MADLTPSDYEKAGAIPLQLSLFIVPFARDDDYRIAIDSVDNSVLSVNATAPKTTQIFFQWLYFADTIKWATPHISY